MASLRRIPSLDRSTRHSSSNPTHCLVRHSSLPPHVVCQPEFSLRGLRRSSSLNRTCYKISPYSVDPSSFHLCTLSSKLPLCRELPLLSRAVSSHGQLDEQPLSADFNIAATERLNSSVLPITVCAGRASHVMCAASRKESIGLQSLDMEESVVYTELRQSMWRFEAPPRFLIHGDIEVKACSTHTHTRDHGSTLPSEDKKQSTQNPTLTSSVDAKGMPLSLRMLKRKRSQGRPQASTSNPCKLVADHDVPSRATSKFCDRPQVLMDVCDTASSHARCDKPLVFRDVGDSVSSHARFDKPWFFTDVGTYASSTKSDKPKFFTDVAAPRVNFDKPQVFSDVGDSVSSAFVSLVYMLRMLQHHTHSVHMRFRASADGFDQSCHEAASLSCRTAYSDMLDSFLWLFQQVFSCTPKLMLLTMILLADFTLHSMTRHVAFRVMPLGEPPTAKSFTFNAEKPIFMEGMVISDGRVDVADFATSVQNGPEDEYKPRISSRQRGGGEELLNEDGVLGNGGCNLRIVSHGGGHTSLDDGGRGSPLQNRTTNEDTNPHGIALSASTPLSSGSFHSVHGKLGNYSREKRGIDLDRPIKHMMVAPVHAPVLETDDYPCFDRTHLTYQHELSMDPDNPLLLSNYAHFLHVVRHDHGRAEELYRRAVRAGEEVDSELMGRFASFLWVAKGDVAEADTAYKAAVVADPTNAFHAGSYAHFLWNVSAEETSCGIMDTDGDATTTT